MITSVQNEKVKLAKMLQGAAKTRRKEGLMVLEGLRLVRDALQTGHQPRFIFTTPDFTDDTVNAHIRAKRIEHLEVSDVVMEHASDTRQPQGILGVFPLPSSNLPPQPKHLLILDSIRDPGNLGTILRTAAAAGVDAVLLSPTCTDAYAPKVLRSGMGAHFRIPLAALSWDDIRHHTRGKKVYIADGSGEIGYYKADWSSGWAVIISSEAHGAGDDAASLAAQRIHIPMSTDTESLNAAVAAGIILFEAMKGKGQ